MKSVYRRDARTLWPLLLTLCWAGCARPTNSNQAGAQAGQAAPFRNAADSGTATTPSRSSLAVPDDGSSPPRDVPFQSQSVPVGTLLSVRLNDTISSEGSGENTTFTAVLDEPIVVDGKAILPRGANVTGRVESAQISGDRRGYVRLTLNSIAVGGRDLSINTSSLFARGKLSEVPDPSSGGSNTVQIEEGRRLTFRLTEPLYLSGQIAVSRR